MDIEKLKYPIGRFQWKEVLNPEERARCIEEIAAAPALLREAVRGLNDGQLDTPYRPEGWTARQVVHHLPDSHMNGYIRTKLALAEDRPTIKPYEEAQWAVIPEPEKLSVELSLNLLTVVHARWVELLRTLTPEQCERRFIHPEYKNEWPVDWIVAHYSWHGRHHAAHITSLRERMGW